MTSDPRTQPSVPEAQLPAEMGTDSPHLHAALAAVEAAVAHLHQAVAAGEIGEPGAVDTLLALGDARTALRPYLPVSS